MNLGIWRGAAAAFVAIGLLGGCGGHGTQAGSQEVRIYNWSDYIDPGVLADFTRETGVRVVYDTFDSNEVQETKVLTGGTG